MGHQNDTMEINLQGLLHYLKRKLWIVAVAVLLCAIGSSVYFKLISQPQYTASTRMYVLNRSDDNNVGSADFQISNYVVNDYKVLITGQNVTKKVIEQLGLQMTPGGLAKRIEVVSATNTRVLQINVTDSDPQRAADIANAVYAVAAEQIQTIMAVDAVQLVYAAEVPRAPSNANMKNSIINVTAIGLLVTVGILAIIYIFDDTIRTEQDVEQYLDLHVWGVIPEEADMKIGQAEAEKPKGLVKMKGIGRR